MIEMMLGAMIVALWVKTIPAAIADAITTMRASKAGQWDLIDKERDRRAARAAARRKAVAAVRAKRHKQAGGNGNYRPGMRAYLGDVYHGFWEDALAKRTVRRAGRPANQYDRAVQAKVGRQRKRTGRFGRAVHLLVDPVGQTRQPADVVPAVGNGRDHGGSPGAPVDPWPDGDEPTLNLAADQPRIACQVCGATLTEVDGGWQHPKGSTCALGYPLDQQESPPAPPTPTLDATADPGGAATTQTKTTEPASNGGATMTAPTTTEINTNEDARQAFAALAAAAAEASDAIAVLEAARAKMAAAANGTADGMTAKAFDVDATVAAGEAAEAISLGTLAGWSELIDAVQAAADRGIKALDKYRDSEDMVASNAVDPTTLAATSS